MDNQFLKGNRRSEIQELRDELQNAEKDRQKDAIKKVISAMTTGKDVSSLFPDVVNCIQTNNIELKKLVYLYIINYAKVQPELAILAVNTFCKDSKDRNPLIRALAIRTMGYIRLTQITEYLVEPLKQCYVDPDPYVRKTAAMCIAKLYGISPSLVIEGGFLEMLETMLMDKNPMVVANVVVTLVEISEMSDNNMFEKMINKNEKCLDSLLNALNQCIEWGQVYILDALVYYNPPSPADAKKVIESISSRFSHINSAVVMSAIKVVLNMMSKISDRDYLKLIQSKLAAPLVTLTSLEPEIQYVALRSILVVIQKFPKLLEEHARSFFCKYTDPLYVKIEKLDIMVRLVTSSNYPIILSELREYATDVDFEFVKHSIKAIGTLSVRLDLALNACVAVILDLLRLKMNHVTEECTVVLRYILRSYPNIYTSEMFKLCSDVECLHNSEAKASLIWMVGQYASEIEDAVEYISNLSEAFHDEPHTVQLSLLTAAMKVHLRCGGADDLISHVIHQCGVESTNPDVRDRAYMYLRLLNSGEDVATKVVLSSLPKVVESSIDKSVLDDLLENLGKVSSIYHLPSWALTFRTKRNNTERAKTTSSDDKFAIVSRDESYSFDEKPKLVEDSDDESSSSNLQLSSYKCEQKILLSAGQRGVNGQMGLEILGRLHRHEDKISLEMKLINKTSALFTLLAIQFNTNSFGLAPGGPLSSPISISPGKESECHILLNPNVIPSNSPPENPITIQVAIKTNLDVFYFGITCDLPIILGYDAKMSLDDFKFSWIRFSSKATNIAPIKVPRLIKALKRRNFFHIGTGIFNDGANYFYGVTTNSLTILLEINESNALVKTESGALMPHTIKMLNELS